MKKSQFYSDVLQARGTISPANIVGTAAGQLGHANGVEMVSAGDADTVTQLVSCMIVNNFGVAAYGGGGNIAVAIGGGTTALTGIAASFDTAASDTIMELVPLAATKLTHTKGRGLNLIDSGAPTQPGTATGVFTYVVRYRRVKTGL